MVERGIRSHQFPPCLSHCLPRILTATSSGVPYPIPVFLSLVPLRPQPPANCTRCCSPGPARSSSDRLKSMLSHESEEFQGCPPWMLFAAFPLAHQTCCHLEIARENRLAGALPQTKCTNLPGFQQPDRREA